MNEKVVFLAFNNNNMQEEHISFSACSACKNKTFIVVHDGMEFPMLKCAACGQHIGRIGWASEA